MFLSIVIPCFNGEKYIERTINNITSQNIDDYEIIVINDGSKDNSLNILNNIKDIKVINQNNFGAAYSRNIGLKNALGEYVFFMDADDLIFDNCLSKIIEILKSSKPDVLIGLYSMYKQDIKIFDVDRNIKNHEINNKSNQEIIECLSKYRLSPCPWRYFLKKEFLINNNLYFKEDSLVEDAIWVPIMLSKANSILLNDEPFYKYFINENSVSTSKKFKFYEDTLIGFEVLYNYSKELLDYKKIFVYKYMLMLLLGLIRDYDLMGNDEKKIIDKWIYDNKLVIASVFGSMNVIKLMSKFIGVNLTLKLLGKILRKKVS